ncbi:lysine--tRNA ligase [Candidatus Bandiella euplotis]|uniref:Lysine--tRNA ligase n=1 Tax=Candidatus Bandiella euplotis TaxID=1664265 RepID=A0ABZ0UQK2_9RICK|nr:lysine--tRNA ligase [Candidatus Bandiella woodruffii]WPX97304.1 Lysine--tRNA ligase [Candidatus Bandiella woodruffii]
MLELDQINSWPFKEAELILKKIGNKVPAKGYVLFETGYGPSGFPHIGTFGEVVRNNMVQKAFARISGIPTKLICVSDDMDGLRKIPDTIPNKEHYKQYLDLPLTKVPDPFGECNSYGEYMNSRLRNFLDSFNFKYEFVSATEYYKSGKFNEYLIKVLEKYDDIMDLMLPTLGQDRQKTYSPFLPICPKTGRVLQVQVVEKDLASRKITYLDEDKKAITVSVLDGNCKLQWKPDFAMRWAALDVDYEMYGKDIQANAYLYDKICRILGKSPPQQMSYELFLDENGQKISKSKGNGVTIEEWLKYGSQESLALFMYQSPKKAKKLYYDIIPKIFDEYLQHLENYNNELDECKRLSNPIFYIHGNTPPKVNLGKISFTLLLNLVNACNTDSKEVAWGYIDNSNPSLTKNDRKYIDSMLGFAINYYQDFVKPKKQYKIPNQEEIKLLQHLLEVLDIIEDDAEKIQNAIYKIGKDNGLDLKHWFSSLYEILLGTKEGPRIGTFVKFYGIKETKQLILDKIKL